MNGLPSSPCREIVSPLHGRGEVDRGACCDVGAALRATEAAIAAARLTETTASEARTLALVEHREDVLEVRGLPAALLTEPAEHVFEGRRHRHRSP